MAKKKKKQTIKINNKVKELMDGEPFDEGIKYLSEDVLVELTMLLDLKVPMLVKKEMIRALRQAWSEGNVQLRLNIVNYLDQMNIKKVTLDETDKVSYIVSLLDKHKHDKEEEQLVLSSFIDTKFNKISEDKIANKLNYIRQQKLMNLWEKKIDVEFNTLSEMEFYHSYEFVMNEETFYKSLLTTTASIENNLLLHEDESHITKTLEQLRLSAISEKTEEITSFLESVKNNHKYLSESEVIKLIRSMPPEDSFYEIEIPLSTLKEIASLIDPLYVLTLQGSSVIVSKEKSYSFYNTSIPYIAVVNYGRPFIFHHIWKGETLPIKDDLLHVKKEMQEHLEHNISDLEDELYELAEGLDLEASEIEEHILKFVGPQLISAQNLKLKEKVKRRIVYHFMEYIRPLKEKRRKEELLAKTIRDFKNLFPLARLLKREIFFHVGPTNSGKTYQALKVLEEADTGYYLAPLRLLALEGYENLKAKNVGVSLITGEEEIIDEESTHISSTIEMMNASVDVDVCVIDEIQMISDRDRGWAWANALIGVPAKKVILTGSADVLDAVTQLCEYLEEPLTVTHFERKNELKLLPNPTPIKEVEKGTAIVAFSRRDVLGLRQQLSQKYEVSVVYGNLSPEVRREEARRFREGKSDVLVATDAIAMGLNLPIKTLLFSKDNKFDGLRRRELLPTEVAQISGRAGRYGLEEVGYIGALDKKALETIESKFYQPLPTLELPFSVMASLDHVMLIGEILETENLSTILTFFAENMEFEGPFVAANIDSMLEISAIVDEYQLDLKTRFHLACAPASISSPYIESVFHRYIKQIEAQTPVAYIPPRDLPSYAQTNEMMLNAEDRVREISLYLWLSFKFEKLFKETQKAIEARVRLNNYIEASLKEGNFVKKCTRCSKSLDFTYRFSICDACFTKGKRGNRSTNRGTRNGGASDENSSRRKRKLRRSSS
ncbi:MAG: Helicase-like [uncultured Sulfurovum sp.]|uniref:Helicase-like n=1 Tax=uncultured Sulfurovum sp. TaxID=269237 RepID=A0A6S6SRU7_9BACT|nr:MAG: Helicase-like [uncultured Sulfurovum sp.]